MNWDYAVYILLIAVVGCRIVLWAKFRGDNRGRRLGILTLQWFVVIAAVAILSWFPNAGWVVLVCAVAGIVALSFVPAKSTKT